MSSIQIVNVLGFVAAGIGIVIFVPQALQVWKTKNTKSISLASFLLLAVASVLWLIYGLLIKAPPIILANSAILILSTYIVLMKLKHG